MHHNRLCRPPVDNFTAHSVWSCWANCFSRFFISFYFIRLQRNVLEHRSALGSEIYMANFTSNFESGRVNEIFGNFLFPCCDCKLINEILSHELQIFCAGWISFGKHLMQRWSTSGELGKSLIRTPNTSRRECINNKFNQLIMHAEACISSSMVAGWISFDSFSSVAEHKFNI